MGRVVGIDLGTTNSCIALLEGGQPVVIPNAEGARTTPSVVAWAASGERLVGQVARRQAVQNPTATINTVKRLMGRSFGSAEVKRQQDHVAYKIVPSENGDAWVEVAGRKMSPPEVSASILGTLKEVAEAYLGETVSEAVITVPAYFDDAQRQATKDAGAIAGLQVRRIVNEPTAAALAYGLHRGDNATGRIAVYDLGGGTFDVSILEIQQGVFRVVATHGDTFLGGEDFDQRIVELLLKEFSTQHKVDLRSEPAALQRLRDAAEKAKHELSSSLETEINLPFIAAVAGTPQHLQRVLRRGEFELLVSDLVERSLETCKQALSDAKMTVTDMGQVLLVGGMTRMPLVQKRVQEFFGRVPHKGLSPDEVVAIGAAVQGASLAGEIGSVLLLDVTPLSLGVETGGGVMTKVVQRNTTIPARASMMFTTARDNQDFVSVRVLQGERDMATDNRLLYEFELAGIPPAPRGVPKIEVSFDIDANGILAVSAMDQKTKRSKEVRVVAGSGLTPEEVERLVSEAESAKGSDAQRRELAEMRNACEALLYTSETTLREYAELITDELRTELQQQVTSLRAALDRDADLATLTTGRSVLELCAFKIAETLYGSP